MSSAIRSSSGIPTIAVGLITEPAQAEEIVASGQADMVALARGMLSDPRWAWHAAAELGGEAIDNFFVGGCKAPHGGIGIESLRVRRQRLGRQPPVVARAVAAQHGENIAMVFALMMMAVSIAIFLLGSWLVAAFAEIDDGF